MCLYRLIYRVEEFDTRQQIMSVISLIVERMSMYITDCANEILSPLPDVWVKSESQNLLKQSIVVMLNRAVDVSSRL